MANSLTLADAVATANTGLDAIKRAPIVEEDTGIKCIRIQDVNQEKQFSEWGNTEVEDRNLEKFQLKENDILIARTGGSVGSNKFIDKEYPAVYNNGLIRVRVDEGNHDPKFIYYLMQTEAFKSHINAIAYSTSAQPNMKIKDFLRFEFKELGLKTEKSIQSILSCLDNKIELNRKTNQTLEQMAQALFKSWFVDFDPVFDNALASGTSINDFPEALQTRAEQRQQVQQQIANGEPSAGKELEAKPLPENIRQLFPSEFEQTDEPSIGINGWIPNGWVVSELSQFIKFANGKAKKSCDGGKYPIYGANGIIGQTAESKFNNAVIVGRVGAHCGAIEYCRKGFWSSDNTIVATSKLSEEHIPHILYLLKFLDLNQYAGGAAQPLLNQTTLNRLKIPFSSFECMMQFNNIIDGFLLKQVKNTEQNQELVKIRDTLLPKLISGELSIPTAKDCA